MTLHEALLNGYKVREYKYQRGYVSRKINLANQPVLTGKGYRKNQLYVLIPCFTSTQYCFRAYLKKDDN